MRSIVGSFLFISITHRLLVALCPHMTIQGRIGKTGLMISDCQGRQELEGSLEYPFPFEICPFLEVKQEIVFLTYQLCCIQRNQRSTVQRYLEFLDSVTMSHSLNWSDTHWNGAEAVSKTAPCTSTQPSLPCFKSSSSSPTQWDGCSFSWKMILIGFQSPFNCVFASLCIILFFEFFIIYVWVPEEGTRSLL